MSNSNLPKLRSGPTTPLEARAGRLLEAADAAEPWPDEARQGSWRRIIARVDEPRRSGLRWLGVAVAALLIVTALVVRRQMVSKPEAEAPLVAAVAAVPPKLDEPPTELRRIDLGSVGTIEVGEATVYQVAPGQPSTLRLDQGRLCAVIRHRDLAREGPFTLVAPKLRVIDLGTRFCVDVTAARTLVEVTEGEVRVEGEDWSTRVVAGQTVASDGPRPAAPAPAVTAPALPQSNCESLRSLDAREACEAAAWRCSPAISDTTAPPR
jgi:ferric-dicitrate binding protein FerR (iron transport regulator)